ncbi:MAG: hypothetical protein GY784_02180 [Gammaproteobacteria bacterium]|nr:hypothetical protein [Gammaproteobacteria bacterium]
MQTLFGLIGCLTLLINLSGCGGGGSGSSIEDSFQGSANDIIVPGKVDQLALKNGADTTFATVGVSEINLPYSLTNAREVYASVRYIARTNQEPEAENTKIPMRSYSAHCTNPNGIESIFVSLTLQDGDAISDNVGSVFEMQYDEAKGGYQRVDNVVKLSGFCRQSHGVAVSNNCSRVAVLCQADPFESQNRTPTKDLVELYGDTYMKEHADNYDEVGDRVDIIGLKANPEIWLLEWENKSLSESYESYVVSKQAGGSGGKTALNLLHVESDSKGRGSYAFSSSTRIFDSNGNSHYSGAQYVIDRDNWSYDIDDSSNGDGRGWSFDCVYGHILQMRTVYNPYTELYSSLCTSDGVAAWQGNTAWGWTYGTIGMKHENQTWGSKGDTHYFVPASNTFTTNGGGHTVVPVNDTTSLMVFVAPQVTPASSMDRFVDYNQTLNGYNSGMSEDETCELVEWWFGGCEINFFRHIADGNGSSNYPIFNNNVISSSQTREPQYYSRIGLMKVSAEGELLSGEGPVWFGGKEWDLDAESNITIEGQIVGSGETGSNTVISCNYSDPQLVDLQNGRYLLGYAKFLCSDHGYTANRHSQRSDRVRGGADVLIPQAYYLAEIDVEGNILEGPVELSGTQIGDLGWGGLDEMITLGAGKAGWVYTSTPTKEPEVDTELPSPLQNQWNMLVYESKHSQ